MILLDINMRCRVRETTGEDAITLDDGQDVHDRIKPELMAGREVELDFIGVSVFAAPFFNAAIGQLLKDIDRETLRRLLHVQNLNALGSDLLRCVIDNSERYYASKEYRDVQVRVVQRLAGEAVSAEDADMESISLSLNPDFVEIIERSRKRQETEGGISSEEMRRRFGGVS